MQQKPVVDLCLLAAVEVIAKRETDSTDICLQTQDAVLMVFKSFGTENQQQT